MKLCKRLGEFVAGKYAADLTSPDPEPVSSINLEEWRQYRKEMATRPVSTTMMEDIRISVMQARHRKERDTLHSRLLPHVPHPPLGAPPGPVRRCPRCLLNIARHFLKLQQREEKCRLRRKIGKQWPDTRPRFETWLRAQGKTRQAENWRYRHMLETMPERMREAPPLPAGQKYDPHKAYAAHRQAALKNAPDLEPSRLDAYIALCMREKGFKRKIVLETIAQYAPQGQEGQTERDWRRYAERATAYAFGVAGDVKLARAAAYLEEKRKNEEAAGQRSEEERREEAQQQAPRMRMR